MSLLTSAVGATFYVIFGYLAQFRLVIWLNPIWLFGVLALVCLDRQNLLMEYPSQRRLIPSHIVYFGFIPSVSTIWSLSFHRKKRTAQGGSLGVVGGATA